MDGPKRNRCRPLVRWIRGSLSFLYSFRLYSQLQLSRRRYLTQAVLERPRSKDCSCLLACVALIYSGFGEQRENWEVVTLPEFDYGSALSAELDSVGGSRLEYAGVECFNGSFLLPHLSIHGANTGQVFSQASSAVSARILVLERSTECDLRANEARGSGRYWKPIFLARCGQIQSNRQSTGVPVGGLCRRRFSRWLANPPTETGDVGLFTCDLPDDWIAARLSVSSFAQWILRSPVRSADFGDRFVRRLAGLAAARSAGRGELQFVPALTSNQKPLRRRFEICPIYSEGKWPIGFRVVFSCLPAGLSVGL